MQAAASVKPSKTLKKTFAALAKGPELLEARINLASIKIESLAKRNIQQVSSGDRVTRYSPPKGKRTVTVSQPGDAPNTDTGTAIKSVRRVIEKGVVFIGTRLRYLALLEFDSVSTKRKARPWLRPVIKEFLKKNKGFFKLKFKRAK